jgi:hypothetical protein
VSTTVMIGTRVAPEVAEQLRDRAEQQDSTVSRVAAGILRRALATSDDQQVRNVSEATTAV